MAMAYGVSTACSRLMRALFSKRLRQYTIASRQFSSGTQVHKIYEGAINMKNFNRMLATLSAIVMLSACSAEPTRGRVVDYDTKQAIEGVLVITYTTSQAFSIVDSKTGCSGPVVVKTDRDGIFIYPAERKFFGLLQGEPMDATFMYKPGYVFYEDDNHHWAQTQIIGKDSARPREWRMKKDGDSADAIIGFRRKLDEKHWERQGLSAAGGDFGCVSMNNYEAAKRQGMCEMFHDIGENLYRIGTTKEHYEQAFQSKQRAKNCQDGRGPQYRSYHSPLLEGEFDAKVKALKKEKSI
jgi:hypothetical protein